MHIFRPQCCETRNQPQEKIWKDNKYLETKEHPTKEEWANQGVKGEIKKYIEANEDDNTTAQNLWDAAKVVIRAKHIAIQAFLKKEERSQIHNLNLHLKELEKGQQIKPQTSRRQEIIKIRAEINAIETKTKKRKQKTRTDQ